MTELFRGREAEAQPWGARGLGSEWGEKGWQESQVLSKACPGFVT